MPSKAELACVSGAVGCKFCDHIRLCNLLWFFVERDLEEIRWNTGPFIRCDGRVRCWDGCDDLCACFFNLLCLVCLCLCSIFSDRKNVEHFAKKQIKKHQEEGVLRRNTNIPKLLSRLFSGTMCTNVLAHCLPAWARNAPHSTWPQRSWPLRPWPPSAVEPEPATSLASKCAKTYASKVR